MVSVPPKKWEEVKWQTDYTDRIRHNKATVVYCELQCTTFRCLSEGDKWGRLKSEREFVSFQISLSHSFNSQINFDGRI